MKKTLLVAALLVSACSLNVIAKEAEPEEEVTLGEVVTEGVYTAAHALAMIAWFKYADDYIRTSLFANSPATTAPDVEASATKVKTTEAPVESPKVEIDTNTPGYKTYDMSLKGFCAVVFGDKAKDFFKKCKAYVSQTAQPITDAATEAVKSVM